MKQTLRSMCVCMHETILAEEMEARMRSLDRELSANPVYGIKSAEEVREILELKTLRFSYAYGPSMHSFFRAEPQHRRITMR